jgi:prepilin-type N-terminal cleavage/methylation domain-containing protein
MKNRKGLTLIETIISIVIIAIVMYAGISIFITAGFRGVDVEVFTVAQSLAEGKLEEVIAENFDNINDISETSYAGDLSSFSYEVVVDYVEGTALDAPVAYSTDYKKIRVLIRHPKLANPVMLETIKADIYEN